MEYDPVGAPEKEGTSTHQDTRNQVRIMNSGPFLARKKTSSPIKLPPVEFPRSSPVHVPAQQRQVVLAGSPPLQRPGPLPRRLGRQRDGQDAGSGEVEAVEDAKLVLRRHEKRDTCFEGESGNSASAKCLLINIAHRW